MLRDGHGTPADSVLPTRAYADIPITITNDELEERGGFFPLLSSHTNMSAIFDKKIINNLDFQARDLDA